MKLQDFHFVTPPKPREEDYTRKVDGIERYYIDPQFEKDTAEWKRLYGDKPEPEWESYNNEEPEVENESVCLVQGEEDSWVFERGGDWCEDTWYRSDGVRECMPCKSTHWADKSTYDTRLAEWQYHQVRYPGWRKISDQIFDLNMKVSINGINRNKKPIARVNFDKLGSFYLEVWSALAKIWMPLYRGKTPSFELFELICKENGIELCTNQKTTS